MIRNKIGPVIDLNNIDINNLFYFKYQKSQYIENLFLPEFQSKSIENVLRNIFK